ncbi:MAG: TraR/DksA family transcriptional regulator [Phycisphaerales bacterium]|nr:MAG: TraR/DksA family transcriptional regulator [Phycisphaerales bacterium]
MAKGTTTKSKRKAKAKHSKATTKSAKTAKKRVKRKTTKKARASSGKKASAKGKGAVKASKPAPKKRATKAVAKAATAKVTAKKTAAASKRRGASRSTKPTAGPTTVDAPAADPKPIPKTRLSQKQLGEFKYLLLAKRAELQGNVVNMTDQALQRSEGGEGGSSSMPIHMADLGSDNWEKEFTLDLIASEQALVKEIDEALARIENRTYGVCVATHKPITLARLRAKPWAKYCIEYARKREEGRLP